MSTVVHAAQLTSTGVMNGSPRDGALWSHLKLPSASFLLPRALPGKRTQWRAYSLALVVPPAVSLHHRRQPAPFTSALRDIQYYSGRFAEHELFDVPCRGIRHER